MDLGKVKYISLNTSTRTTFLLDEMYENQINTLCLGLGLFVKYENDLSGKCFSVSLYVAAYDRHWLDYIYTTEDKYTNLTFTELKYRYGALRNIDANDNFDDDILLKNICDCVRKNHKMRVDTERDCFFKKTITFQAQGVKNRGWGHTHSEYIVGVKLYRVY